MNIMRARARCYYVELNLGMLDTDADFNAYENKSLLGKEKRNGRNGKE